MLITASSKPSAAPGLWAQKNIYWLRRERVLKEVTDVFVETAPLIFERSQSRLEVDIAYRLSKKRKRKILKITMC